MGLKKCLMALAICWIPHSSLAFQKVSQDLNIHCPSHNCAQLQKNLATDSLSCAPPVSRTFRPLSVSGGAQVSGSLLYFSLVRAPYSYDVFPRENGGMLVGLRIGVEVDDFKRSRWENLWVKVRNAEVVWNIFAPFGMSFAFQVIPLTENPSEDVHFKVRLTPRLSRGPYNQTWSEQWDSVAVAHEIGHMLGLNDEYDFSGSTSQCDEGSLMCSLEGWPVAYHYYLIARRVQCEEGLTEPLAIQSEYEKSIRSNGVDILPEQSVLSNNCIADSTGRELCI